MSETMHSTGSSRIGLWIGVGTVLVVVGGATFLAWRMGHNAMASTQANEDQVERGRYLVMTVGCSDCHTPFKMTDKGPAPDTDRMFSGHPEPMKLPPAPTAQGPWIWSGVATNTAFAGPWGLTYSANITSDRDTGLGLWTEEMFLSAMRTGKHFGNPGGRDIQPPMPWRFYSQMTDRDLKAMFAYLKTVNPIRNQVPPYEPPGR